MLNQMKTYQNEINRKIYYYTFKIFGVKFHLYSCAYIFINKKKYKKKRNIMVKRMTFYIADCQQMVCFSVPFEH